VNYESLLKKEVVVEFGDLNDRGEYPFQKGILTYIDDHIVVLDFKGKKNLIRNWIKIREINGR